jgi:hypothetical protein
MMILKPMFYNFNYNYLSPTGQLRYCWGINEFDLNKPLIDQLLVKAKLTPSEVFNVNLTSFNPIILDNIEEETKE